jgi:hypothetical protein
MPRPPKFPDGSLTASFKIDPKILKEAHQKAENQNTTLSDVLQNFLKSYVGVNSPLVKLEKRRSELQRKLDRTRVELEAVEAEIRAKTKAIDDDHVRFYIERRKQWTKDQAKAWLEKAAKSAGMSYGKYVLLMKKRVKEVASK